MAACGDSDTRDAAAQAPVQVDTTLYGHRYQFPNMDPALDDILTNWSIFLDFRARSSELHDLKLEPLRQKINLIQAHADTMRVRLPDTLNTSAIDSRLRIISTRISLLKQEVAKDRINPASIENEIGETNEAIKNFYVQLNEKIQKDAIDRSRTESEQAELKKQQRFRDSIFELELQDQND